MKNPLNRDEFEVFLQQEVNQHRMYPSDQIWRNIQQDIHGYKKWPALTVITLFVISALVVGTVLIKPPFKAQPAATANATGKITDVAAKQQASENVQEHFSPEHITQQTIAKVTNDIDITDNIPNAFAAYNNVADITGIYYPAITDNNTAANTTAISATSASGATATEQKTSTKKDVAAANTRDNAIVNNWINLIPDANFNVGGQVLHGSKQANKTGNTYMFSLFSRLQPTPYNDLTLDNSFSQPAHKSFSFKPKSRRFDFAFYAGPSVSYRQLSYPNQGIQGHTYISGIPYNANYTVDLKRTVRNKPATGYEVGAALGYKLNNILTLRGGFQFNMREYDIAAYKQTSSTSNFGIYPGAIPGGLDISNQTSSTIGASDKVILQNRYYEISMPIGLDLRAWKSGKFAWGVAAGVQPTYIFDKDPFIITSDYKNYVDGSKLVRNWNINSNVETYISYTTGQFKWQLGPQFRYQVLSTLSGSYPIKEHLLDYGVKIGFVKSLP